MKRTLTTLWVVGLLASATTVFAQFPGDVPDTLRFRVGGIFVTFQTDVDFDVSGLPSGGLTSLENALGVPDTETTFSGNGSWNFLGRSYLDVGYQNFTRQGTKAITEDIVFGGNTYTASSQVTTEFSARYTTAAYRYGFIKNPIIHLGASLGVSYVTLKTSLSATAGVTGPGGPVSGTVTTEEKLNLPVPLLGLVFEARILKDLSVGAQVQAVGGTLSPWSGSVVQAAGHVDWYPLRYVGLGAGYEYSKINIEKSTSTQFLKFEYRYDGPRAYLVLSF